ncbi:11276_t:CDS:1 [Dentiscutata erythropus]|uniref:11276_t:CDS:1 n=1 Tax=Dentiscutata erythropus TaxID=1348616 RepID=A0A9N9ADN9_9GLOM|nr:11276_t:CDS:1 [Dentiscutata erythropus]
MNQTTNQIIGVQPQNNNGRLQRLQNIGGPRNANSQVPRIPNIGMPPLRTQNNVNLFTSNFTAVQHDLINGTDPFTRMQGVENLPPQSPQLSAVLFLGVSFP